MNRKINIFYVITTLLLGTSCVASKVRSVAFEPDLSLLRPWGESLSRERPFEDPYVVRFNAEEKRLIYVASAHGIGIHSETFTLIKKNLAELDPQALIIEGINPSYAQEKIRNIPIKNHCVPDFVQCGEIEYVIHLAPPKSIIFSGEPTDRIIGEQMQVLGYKKAEVAFFYLLRMIPQWKRENKLQNEAFEEQAKNYIKIAKDQLQVADTDLSYPEFLKWYREKAGKEFSPQDIDSETPAPYFNGTYIQKMSHEVGNIRDGNILKVIASTLAHYSRAMIVYGGSHFLVQQKVLEKMLGKPAFEK